HDAHAVRRKLCDRLRRTIQPGAYWTCLRPDYASLVTNPGRGRSLIPIRWELRLVLPDVHGQEVLRGWGEFQRWQKTGKVTA
ncbi:hypothetical protein SB781_38520, partial [Paraburkholderia sp. SIMBA_061]